MQGSGRLPRRLSWGLTLAPFVTCAVGALLFYGVGCTSRQAQVTDEIVSRQSSANAYQLITGEDVDDERKRWDALYRKGDYVMGTEPLAFLRENADLLPRQGGRALMIPMEEGRNAVFVAKQHFHVDGVDYSDVALQKAKKLAWKNGVASKLQTINADLNFYKINKGQYDVIFDLELHRDRLIPEIKSGLKRGGMVFYEGYTVDQIANARGKTIRRDYLLEKGELRDAFKDFEILYYRESNDGRRAVASLIARKP